MSIRQTVAHGWRSLRRTPVFGATVVLTLTIGIGAAAAIFAVVNAVLLRPLPYGHPDRLVGAWHNMPALSLTHAEQTVGTYNTYKKFARSIEGIALYDNGSVNVTDPTGSTAPERIQASYSTANLFPVLEVHALLGRTYTAQEDAPKAPDVVVISEGYWRSHLGARPNVLGTRITISGKPREIIGVMPTSFQFPSSKIEMWLPLQLDPNDPYPGGFNHDGV